MDKMDDGEYKNIFAEAIEKESIAGFQNIGDAKDACNFAKDNDFDIESKQELRSLILPKPKAIWLMFILKLKDGKDIVVFHKGRVKQGEFGGTFLKTKPTKILLIEEVLKDGRI